MGDQHDFDAEKREILSDEESGEIENPSKLQNAPQASTCFDIRGSGTFRSARFPLQGTSLESENILHTSFTEGDPMDRSITGGGFENEIRQLKTLLGKIALEVNVKATSRKNFGINEELVSLVGGEGRDSSIGMNKTFEFHNAPPAMPTKSLMTNCLSAKVSRKSKTPKAGSSQLKPKIASESRDQLKSK